MITRMMLFILFISLSCLCWADLSGVGKRLNVQENIHFSNSDKCQETVKTALSNIGFTVEKAEKYEQGPTIWGVSGDKTLKSTTKCMLRYDLVITFVIGKEDNLAATVSLNEEIKRLAPPTESDNHPTDPSFKKQIETKKKVVSPTDGEKTDEENLCGGDFTQWDGFTRFAFVRKIETPRGFLILKTPARNAEVVKRSQDSSIFVIGYINTKEGKFYMTRYNCELYEKNGDGPYWHVLK